MMINEEKCPRCGTEPFQHYNVGTVAKCHVCGTIWKVKGRMNESQEICIRCGEPTGKAGKGEDSLYHGDVGPFCNDCFDKEDVKESNVPTVPKTSGIKPIGTFEESIERALTLLEAPVASPRSISNVDPELRKPPAPGRTLDDLKKAWIPVPQEGGGMTEEEKRMLKAELVSKYPGAKEEWTIEEVIRALMGSILELARRYATGRYPIEDAVQQGILGVYNAIKTDGGKSPFAQYAWKPIAASIRRASFESDVVRTPEKTYDSSKMVEKIVEHDKDFLGSVLKMANLNDAERKIVELAFGLGKVSEAVETRASDAEIMADPAVKAAIDDIMIAGKMDVDNLKKRKNIFSRIKSAAFSKMIRADKSVRMELQLRPIERQGGMFSKTQMLGKEVPGTEGEPTTFAQLIPAAAGEREMVRAGEVGRELKKDDPRVVKISPRFMTPERQQKIEANRELLDRVLRYAKLTPEEHQVTILTYGMDDGIEKGTKEIAGIIGKKPQRVSDIKSKALAKLTGAAKMIRALSRHDVPEARELEEVSLLIESIVEKLIE